jgi:hypothetical protein
MLHPSWEKAMTQMFSKQISKTLEPRWLLDMDQVYKDRAFMIHVLSNLGEDYKLAQYRDKISSLFGDFRGFLGDFTRFRFC